MLGIVPAAGLGSRIQPLAFSKELLPVGSRHDGGIERPRAVSEYLIDRMLLAGADRICMVISPGKSDIVEYYGAEVRGVPVCYVVQPTATGLCDALFRALPVVQAREHVLVGLPDTVWFPEHGLRMLQDGLLALLLFPVENPQLFDAVLTDRDDNLLEVEVKSSRARSSWIWGAFKMPAGVLRELHELWTERNRADEYFGTLINAYLRRGGRAKGVKAGEAYVDVGTLHGYRNALGILAGRDSTERSRHV